VRRGDAVAIEASLGGRSARATLPSGDGVWIADVRRAALGVGRVRGRGRGIVVVVAGRPQAVRAGRRGAGAAAGVQVRSRPARSRS
jgi:hypothetical protein